MPLYKPSDLNEFLIEHGLNPKKVLSQNFLIDGNILKKIISTATITPGEIVLEIGPGPGALTEQLVDAKAHVIAVEKDHELSALLPRLGKTGHLETFNSDIMDFPIEETIQKFLKPGTKAKVIANLPYHLTTPILEKIAPMHHIFSKIIVMVQDEVALRFAAQPKSSEYGSFTVFLNYYATVYYGFQVKKNSFYPAPKVDSALVILDLNEPPKVSDQTKFFELTRRAFQQRRKMLKVSLAELYPKDLVMKTLVELQLDPFARPQDLSLANFIAIYESLNHSTNLH